MPPGHLDVSDIVFPRSADGKGVVANKSLLSTGLHVFRTPVGCRHARSFEGGRWALRPHLPGVVTDSRGFRVAGGVGRSCDEVRGGGFPPQSVPFACNFR